MPEVPLRDSEWAARRGGGTVAEAEAALRPTEKPTGPGRSVGPVLLLTISKASKSKFYRMSTNSKHLVEPDGGDALTSGPVCFSHEQV